MFFGIDKSNGDSPGRSKNDNHSCEQLAASVDPRTIQIQYDPTWSNNIIQWYPMIMSGDWLIDQRYSTNHLDLIGIIRSPTGNMMIIPSPIPWGYHGLNLGGPKASLDSADDWGRHAGWPQFFLVLAVHKGSPRGPVNILYPKTLKILRFTQQVMKNILKPWWIHENEPLKLGNFTWFFHVSSIFLGVRDNFKQLWNSDLVLFGMIQHEGPAWSDIELTWINHII